MNSKLNDTQVVIAGGGPVGLGLAIELGQRGIRCMVVERYEKTSPIPKGQNLTQRTMEHFHFWGVEKELRAARTIPSDYGIGGLTCYGTLLGEYTYDWLQREVVREYYFTDNERLPQFETENVLRQRANHLPSVNTLHGWKVSQINQNSDSTEATLTHLSSGEMRTVNANYLVGCDGSHSLTRQQAGITQTQTDHDRLMVLLVFKSTALHELLKRYPGKSFYNVLHPALEGYWRFFGRVDLGSTWFFHAPVPPNTTKDNFDFNKYLTESVGEEIEIHIEHIGFWDLRFASADTYRANRIFIAGDAAHSHPPYGAFGINTGFEDARNLGWKLAATLQNWAPESILSSYCEERRPVFQSTAHEFIEKVISADADFLDKYNPLKNRTDFEREWQERASGTGGQVNSFEPNYRGSSIVCGPPDATCNAHGPHSFVARAGHHLAPQDLSSGNSVYTELGSGFTLLAFDAENSLIQEFQLVANELGVPLKLVTDTYAENRTKYESRLILVRPDQYVAWAHGSKNMSAKDVLTRAIAYPTAPD